MSIISSMKKLTARSTDICIEVIHKLSEEISNLPVMKWSSINKKTSALIIVDVVNGFIREGAMASQNIESIIPPIVSLMEKCKKDDVPMVAFADCHEKDCAEFASFPEHCVENTSESELVDEVKKAGGYILLKKNSTNGFHEKGFQKCIMENPGTDTFIVTGDCTDICVMQFCLTLKTWYTQQNKQVDIIVPADCVETYDSPDHPASFMNLASYKLMKDSGIKFVKTIK